MKDIPGYDDYAITDCGKVWSYKRNRFLTIRLDKDGYEIVNLSIKGKQKIGKIHRLVLLAFIGKDQDKTSVDHIDNIKTNNHLSNLRWVTQQENEHNRKHAKGYYWNKIAQKWKAQIIINNKHIHLGLYQTEDEARQAYLDAKKIHHPTSPIK
jgi:hypothetical protein